LQFITVGSGRAWLKTGSRTHTAGSFGVGFWRKEIGRSGHDLLDTCCFWRRGCSGFGGSPCQMEDNGGRRARLAVAGATGAWPREQGVLGRGSNECSGRAGLRMSRWRSHGWVLTRRPGQQSACGLEQHYCGQVGLVFSNSHRMELVDSASARKTHNPRGSLVRRGGDVQGWNWGSSKACLCKALSRF